MVNLKNFYFRLLYWQGLAVDCSPLDYVPLEKLPKGFHSSKGQTASVAYTWWGHGPCEFAVLKAIDILLVSFYSVAY